MADYVVVNTTRGRLCVIGSNPLGQFKLIKMKMKLNEPVLKSIMQFK